MIKGFRDRIFSRFETSIIDAARAISDRYVQISTYIRRSLKAPDDVEAMEKYISDLTTERIGIK
jgi:dynein heavy chain